MKRLIVLCILTQLIGWTALADSRSDYCAQQKQKEWIKINAEFVLQDQQCVDDNDRPSMTCPGNASLSNQNHTPIDFIYSFLINPFFTTTFLAPEECPAPGKNS